MKLRLRYDLTLEEFDAMRREQDGKCAICLQLADRLVVDHDHLTNRVRQLLCVSCNATLGHLEKEGWLAAATKYLERHYYASFIQKESSSHGKLQGSDGE